MNFRNWCAHPELRLIGLALPMELLWEVAQFPLYDVWHTSTWGYHLYALLHCTLGDLLILLVAYELIAFATRSRRWYVSYPLPRGLAFTLLGAVYTIMSEIVNVRAGSWDYTDQMPIVPWLGIGTTPLLQWLLIPPLLLWLMRQTEPMFAPPC